MIRALACCMVLLCGCPTVDLGDDPPDVHLWVDGQKDDAILLGQDVLGEIDGVDLLRPDDHGPRVRIVVRHGATARRRRTPVIGVYHHYPAVKYVPLLQNLGTRGFSVFLGDQMTPADFSALAGVAAATIAAG